MRNFKRTFIAFTTVLTNRISPERQKNGIVHLRDKDHEKMKTILRAIVTKANRVNSKEHREFWRLQKKNGDLIKILDSHITRYAISFYEDALISKA